jgi:hypothetical protein
LRLVSIFDAPVPFDMWRAPWRAQAQIAAAWLLGSVALTAIGWVLVAIYLPLATNVGRYDVAVLWDAAAVIPGLWGGLLLSMVAHAGLTVGFIALGSHCGLSAADDHVGHTFVSTSSIKR